jgi:ribosomal protein S18 acetylase RimI-like enzyme
VASTSGATRAVRAFTRADLQATIDTMVRAFADDPLMVWIFPDEQLRARQLPKFFAISFRELSLRREGTEILVEGQAVLGSAIWVPPGAWRPSVWQQLRTLPRYARALGSRMGVASATYGTIVRCHPHRPHWYLSGIGTEPAAQGTGVGSALMRSRLVQCDAAGQPAYLESSKEQNVPFYQRHGFQVTRELSIGGGGPTLWLMWREPGAESR